MADIGDRLGAYVLQSCLGEGTFGSVWRATHDTLHSQHAVKLLHGKLAATPDWRDRFVAEGRILAQLRHPNLVRVTDVLLQQDSAALVMDLVVGRPLSAWIEDGPLPDDDVITLFRGVIEGLAAVHAAGVVHRDLKPDNILVDASGAEPRAVLVDFGIAKVLQGAVVDTGDRKATRQGAVMGTPQYMSPEQIEATHAVDARTDLFAAGAILYELLTGRPAFSGEGTTEIMYRVTKGDHAPLDGLAAPVATLLSRCLSVDPAERPESAAALRQDFDLAASLGPLRAKGPVPAAPRREPTGPTASPQTLPLETSAATVDLEPAPTGGFGPGVGGLVAFAALVLVGSLALGWMALTSGGDNIPSTIASTPSEAAELASGVETPRPRTVGDDEPPVEPAAEPEPEPEPEAVAEPAPPAPPAPKAGATPKPSTRPADPDPPKPVVLPAGSRVEQAWKALEAEAVACLTPGTMWRVAVEVDPVGAVVRVDPSPITGDPDAGVTLCLRRVAAKLSTDPLGETVRRVFRVVSKG